MVDDSTTRDHRIPHEDYRFIHSILGAFSVSHTNRSFLSSLILLALIPFLAFGDEKPKVWSPEIETALKKADTNRVELEKALKEVPEEQFKGMSFLVVHMPDPDLRSLKAEFLLENVALAYKSRKQLSWGKKIPEEIFLNDVLPYANIDESRDPWRKELFELCEPFIKDCKTPSEAVQILNTKVFEKLKVRYSTQRKKPNQSPKESIEISMASCTGLSILLSDACRSVCIPARLVGTPLWSNKRGNHTWVEIWDDGWHFTGACEPDPKGLDRGWFVGDAAQAKKDIPEHAIYASSFRKTDVSFPLVWAPKRKDVFAENVTSRYAKEEKPKETIRVMIRIWESGKRKRLSVPFTLTDSKDLKKTFPGESKGESADTNDIIAFELQRNHTYLLKVEKPIAFESTIQTKEGKEQIVEVEIPQEKSNEKPNSLTKEQIQEIEKELTGFFASDAEKQAKWKFDSKYDEWLFKHESELRNLAWKAYQSAPIHDAIKKDFETKLVRSKDHVSPYTVKEVGKRPKNGWPLFIAMHGGGGAPKNVNDSQWAVMQKYYKDQDSVTGYKYLALRAPNDVWNGFYDDYVPPLIINLIRQFTVLGDVDPNKVFIMGYSHGGYGAFFIGPKIPDRFAAVHCSAAAPTDGTISPLTLRNTRFTFMIGEKDTAYGRKERCERFDKEVQKLKEANKGEFPVEMEFKQGFGHGGLPDRDKIKEMYSNTRNSIPSHLSWELMDSVVSDFFWLSVPKPEKGKSIDAKIVQNTIQITTRNVSDFQLGLDSRQISFDQPIQILLNENKQEVKVQPKLLTLCLSMLERGDRDLAFTCKVPLVAQAKK
jgi:predicted peptidase